LETSGLCDGHRGRPDSVEVMHPAPDA